MKTIFYAPDGGRLYDFLGNALTIIPPAGMRVTYDDKTYMVNRTVIDIAPYGGKSSGMREIIFKIYLSDI